VRMEARETTARHVPGELSTAIPRGKSGWPVLSGPLSDGRPIRSVGVLGVCKTCPPDGSTRLWAHAGSRLRMSWIWEGTRRATTTVPWRRGAGLCPSLHEAWRASSAVDDAGSASKIRAARARLGCSTWRNYCAAETDRRVGDLEVRLRGWAPQ
jgi:hypothetical protein